MITRPSGYVLALGPDEVDAQRFLKLVDLGRGHAREQRQREAAETFYRQLMLALDRFDRRGDALKVFRSAHLQGELGLEPCRALQEVQRAILVAGDWVLLDAVGARLGP
jgi:hypothetical protein